MPPSETVKSSSSELFSTAEPAWPAPPPSADIVRLESSRAKSADDSSLSRDDSSLSRLVYRLRFRHLCLLVALDDQRNLHRAARTVHLSQPTASKTIHDLESMFRSPLFDRVPTGMEPTEFGTVVLDFARRALSELKRIAAASDHRHQHADEHLVIGLSGDLSTDSVAEAMADLKRLRPELPVKVICDSNDGIVNHLISGDVDLAVGYLSDRLQPGLVDYEAMSHETLCILARHQHPLAEAPTLSAHQLQGTAWILQSHSSSAREIIDQLFHRARMSPPANVVESDSVPMTLNMLVRSDALALLPERVAHRPLQEGLVVRLLIALDPHRVDFGILTRQGDPLSPAAQEFRQALRNHRAD